MTVRSFRDVLVAETMILTAIELTDDEARRLNELATRRGESFEQLTRRAVVDFLDRNEPDDWRAAIHAASGIWADRTDLPDFQALRAEFDRR
ncbi:MAG: hypothetical protein WBC44_21295 [Planctomycetaceae bacterium]